MNTPPSARPPSSSSRRTPDIDSPAARAFVEAAGSPSVGGPGGQASAPATAEPIAASPPTPVPTLTTPSRPASPVKEIMKPLTLRIPESLHAQLLFIAENSPRSMNRFVLDALVPVVEAECRKIEKRNALCLD